MIDKANIDKIIIDEAGDKAGVDKAGFESYLAGKFGEARLLELSALGEGAHGTGYLALVDTPAGRRKYVVKTLGHREDLGHLYPSDRAAVFLLAFDEYGNLPRHVRPVDVLSHHGDGSLHSISGGVEYYLVMELAEGVNYFTDLHRMGTYAGLRSADARKIDVLARYLSEIHAVKIDSKAHYYRKLRDTIGHGECIMGVFDSYPEGIVSFGEMAEVEKKCIDWRARLKPRYERLSEIHGDFHPGNILFTGPEDFVLLDRSRGPWGDTADDVTALAINYVFFSIIYHGTVEKAYFEGLNLLFRRYVELTGDEEILKVTAPFFAFRGVVVANPKFYPDVTPAQRALILRFINNVLDSESFSPAGVNEYLK